MSGGSIFDRRSQPLWGDCDPSIQNVVRSMGLRTKYDKPAIERALQTVMASFGSEPHDLLDRDVLRKILSRFGIKRVRVDGLWSLDAEPCVLTFTHFYSTLDSLMLYYGLADHVGLENLIVCGRGNTLRRIELGGTCLLDLFGSQMIELRQKYQGGPIADLRETSQAITDRLTSGKMVMISCTPGTTPLDVGLDAQSFSLPGVKHGFAYFASRAKVPVRCAVVLIRPSGEAVISLAGPFPVPAKVGYAHTNNFAATIIAALEERLASLFGEEQHWSPLPL